MAQKNFSWALFRPIILNSKSKDPIFLLLETFRKLSLKNVTHAVAAVVDAEKIALRAAFFHAELTELSFPPKNINKVPSHAIFQNTVDRKILTRAMALYI